MHNGFPSYKTKFLHMPMPFLSSSFSPWLMSYPIHPSFLHVPFLCFPFQDCVWYSIFWSFSLHVLTVIIVFPITHIFFPTTIVSLTVPFSMLCIQFAHFHIYTEIYNHNFHQHQDLIHSQITTLFVIIISMNPHQKTVMVQRYALLH